MCVYKEFKKSGVGEINRHYNVFWKNNSNNNLLPCTLLPQLSLSYDDSECLLQNIIGNEAEGDQESIRS